MKYKCVIEVDEFTLGKIYIGFNTGNQIKFNKNGKAYSNAFVKAHFVKLPSDYDIAEITLNNVGWI